MGRCCFGTWTDDASVIGSGGGGGLGDCDVGE